MSTSSNAIPATLEKMLDSRNSMVVDLTSSFVCDFEEDLKANKVVFKDGLDSIAIEWFPESEDWKNAPKKCCEALAAEAKMRVTWNGCTQCPIVFRPEPKKDPKAAEALAKGLRALSALIRGTEVNEADLFAMAGAYINKTTNNNEECYGGYEPCEHNNRPVAALGRYTNRFC